MSSSISSLKTTGRRCFFTNYFTEINLSNQKCRFYSTRPFNPTTYYTLSPSLVRSFTTSNPKPKTGLIQWYLVKLNASPIITKTITTSLIFASADLTAQMLSKCESFDLKRTTRMAAYGLFLLGPSQHIWFNTMSKVFPKQDTLSTLKKTFMGQAVYGPLNASVFFSYNAALQGESGDEIAARLKRDVLPTLKNGLMYWPICDFFTYKFVPVHLQPLVNSTCAYFWTIYLTYMASLQKVEIS